MHCSGINRHIRILNIPPRSSLPFRYHTDTCTLGKEICREAIDELNRSKEKVENKNIPLDENRSSNQKDHQEQRPTRSSSVPPRRNTEQQQRPTRSSSVPPRRNTEQQQTRENLLVIEMLEDLFRMQGMQPQVNHWWSAAVEEIVGNRLLPR